MAEKLAGKGRALVFQAQKGAGGLGWEKIIFCSQSGPCRRAFEEERQQSGGGGGGRRRAGGRGRGGGACLPPPPRAGGAAPAPPPPPRADLCCEASELFCEKHAVKIAAQRMRLYTRRAKPLGEQPVKVLPAGGGEGLKFPPDLPQRPSMNGKTL